MRESILNQLQIDFKNNFSSNNGYKVDIIDCIQGVADFDSIEQYPTIGFVLNSDEILSEDLGMYRVRILNVIIYGVNEIEYNNVSPLYVLIEEIEKFLLSEHWTYNSNTNLGNVEIYAGGIDKLRGYFTLEIKVTYSQNI
jgi:hypothetical protein